MGCCDGNNLIYFKSKCFLALFPTVVGSDVGDETVGASSGEGSLLVMMMRWNSESVPCECEKCCLSHPQIFMVKPEVFPEQPIQSNDLSSSGCHGQSVEWHALPACVFPTEVLPSCCFRPALTRDVLQWPHVV